MQVADHIRKVFHQIGYNENVQYAHLFVKPILISLLTIAICLSTLFSIVFKSDSDDSSNFFPKRIFLVMAAKDMNLVLTVLLFGLDYMIATKNMKIILSVIDKKFPKYFKKFPKAQNDLIVQSKKEQTYNCKVIALVTRYSIGNMAVLPAVISAYIIYEKGLSATNISDLLLPILSWYPKNYTNIYTYIVMYTCHLIFLINLVGISYCIFTSIFCSIQTLVLEIKLFCLNINDIDRVLIECGKRSTYDEELHDYTKFLVGCHQEIIRYVKVVSQCTKITVTFTNQNICFQICVWLYCTAEVDNKLAKLGYFSIALTAAVMLFVYTNCGQNIVTAGEELKECLHKCSWLNKPKRFKKDLLIIMTMAEKPLQIKPFGLYVLDLKTFTTIINASYSYFNLLKTIKN